MWFWDIEEVGNEYRGGLIRSTISTVFAVAGKATRSLCFGVVSYIIRKVLAIYGEIRQQQRSGQLLETWKLGMPQLRIYTRECRKSQIVYGVQGYETSLENNRFESIHGRPVPIPGQQGEEVLTGTGIKK